MACEDERSAVFLARWRMFGFSLEEDFERLVKTVLFFYSSTGGAAMVDVLSLR